MQAWTTSPSIRQVNRSHVKLSPLLTLPFSTGPRPTNEGVVRKNGVISSPIRIRFVERYPKTIIETHTNGNTDTATSGNGEIKNEVTGLRILKYEPSTLLAVDGIEEVQQTAGKPIRGDKSSDADQDRRQQHINVISSRAQAQDRYLAQNSHNITERSKYSIQRMISDSPEEQIAGRGLDVREDRPASPSHSLPRPPFMQAKMRRGRKLIDFREEPFEGNKSRAFRDDADVNVNVIERSQRVKARPSPRVRNTVFHLSVKRSLKDNLLQAPFSTLFNHNPYAHALAAPVREDCFSGAHLPNSCLLDFHIVDPGLKPEDRSLLPISLAAELVPKKKKKPLSAEEAMAIAAQDGNASFQPEGAASYILGTKAAVQFVTNDPQKRLRSMVLSRRVNIELGAQNSSRPLKWRDDMPGLVLESMQKVVAKRLSWLFRAKVNKEKSGMLFEILHGVEKLDLSRINDADDPSCILQLTSLSGPGPGIHELTTKEDDVAKNVDKFADTPLNPMSLTKQESVYTPGDLPEDIQLANGDNPNSEEQPIEEDENIEEEPFATESPPSSTLPNTKQKKRQTGWWINTRNEELHAGTRLLPPPLRPLLTKYPTLLYRNRAIPIYNLPQLLGEERTASLLKGTVFETSKYVAIGAGQGTMKAQVWLLRLQLYMAEDRSYKAMKRERKWTKEWFGDETEEDMNVSENDDYIDTDSEAEK